VVGGNADGRGVAWVAMGNWDGGGRVVG
jgi:hypothetical protein